MTKTMFKQITDKLNYHELETEILKFWETNDIFKQSIITREGKPAFIFYEGPPTANGRPGIHHVMARTLKDIVCRYKTMQGFQVHRKAGWDTHGLPVEIEVEKMLGFKHKDDIVAYGVAKFNEECKKSVWKYKTDWEKMTKEMGYWVDLEHPYVTFHNDYIESVWWALQQYFDKGLIYKGYKIQPYLPALRNAIIIARSFARLQRRQRSICLYQITSEGRRQHLLSCLDDDTMDINFERGNCCSS